MEGVCYINIYMMFSENGQEVHRALGPLLRLGASCAFKNYDGRINLHEYTFLFQCLG